MHNPDLAGGVHLGRQGVPITNWSIFTHAVVRVEAKPVAGFGGEYNLQVINVLQQSGAILPYDRDAMIKLRDNINEVLGESE